MANKDLFGSAVSAKTPTATNAAGGSAYSFDAEQELAQVASTGCFNDTYYESGASQLDKIRVAADKVSPKYLAQVAVYSRQKGYMKDMPAALLAMLSKADPVLFQDAFDAVVDNGKMLRNFVQMIRSGAFGRKSLGSGPKRAVARYLNGVSPRKLLNDSVGNSPSLADCIKLSRPDPKNPEREALFGYLIGKSKDAQRMEALPSIVKHFEAFKGGTAAFGDTPPAVDFRLLSSLKMTPAQWGSLIATGGWHFVRMNLNTFQRNGVFEGEGAEERIALVAKKLADKDTIAKSKVFPYQLLAAFLNIEDTVPAAVKLALQEAVEVATQNVPTFGEGVYAMVDTSGSMSSNKITGNRPGAASKIRCIDVAALIASCVLRRNKLAHLVPFDTAVHIPGQSNHNHYGYGSASVNPEINPLDSIMTNATKLASFGGGGTECAVALQHVNAQNGKGNLVIYVSDNESWANDRGGYRGTGLMQEWTKFKARNPQAKLVCIDLIANSTTQAVGKDILNVGGFSDNVFEVISNFLNGSTPGAAPVDFVSQIKLVDVAAEATKVRTRLYGPGSDTPVDATLDSEPEAQ